MGKIVKYCSACEESFAEKFVFCPNCAAPMTAFEMSPVTKDAPPVEEIKPSVVEETKPMMDEPVFRTSEAVSARVAPPVETAPIVETPAVEDFSAYKTQNFSNDLTTKEFSLEEVLEEDFTAVDAPIETAIVEDAPIIVEESPVEEVPTETRTFAAAAAAGANGNGNFHSPTGNNFQTSEFSQSADDVFRVTVIEEKNGKQRNGLLLGSMVLVTMLALGGTVYSLFTKDLGIGAIDDGGLFAAVVVEDVPMEVEEQPKKDKDEGGGGGGGGKDEPEPASKGRLVSQSEKPIFPPSAKLEQVTNPAIPIIQETKGNIKRPITEERAGLPGSDNLNPSNGRGTGGGIGSGSGTGIGGGNGTGEGNGDGSGSGNGRGNGNGDGTGNGSGGPPPPPTRRPDPPVEVVTTPFRIISKPRPGYTDAARQNQVTGVVRLKVTFLASGAIGSIAPVSGLPYGLTEQAIAAARQIKFEPQKKNGQAQAVTKTIEYSFSIY